MPQTYTPSTGSTSMLHVAFGDIGVSGDSIPTANIAFNIAQDGSIRSQVGSTAVAQHSFRFSPGKLHYVEFRYDPATGDIRVWVDDSLVLNYVKEIPSHHVVSFIMRSGLSPLFGADPRIQFGNWYILSEDGIAPTVRLGPTTRVVGTKPASDSGPNDFERPSGFSSNAEIAAQPYDENPTTVLRADEKGATEFYKTTQSNDVATAQLVHAVAVRSTMSNLDMGTHAGESLLRSGETVATSEDIPYSFGCIRQFKHLLDPDNETDYFESVHVVPDHGMFATSRTLGIWACGVNGHQDQWTKVFDAGVDEFFAGRLAASAPDGTTLLVPERVRYSYRPVSQRNQMLKFDPALGEITDPAAWAVVSLGIHEQFEPADVVYVADKFLVASSFIRYHASDAAALTANPEEGIWTSSDGGATWVNVCRRFTSSVNNNQGWTPYPYFFVPDNPTVNGIRLCFMQYSPTASASYANVLIAPYPGDTWTSSPSAYSSYGSGFQFGGLERAYGFAKAPKSHSPRSDIYYAPVAGSNDSLFGEIESLKNTKIRSPRSPSLGTNFAIAAVLASGHTGNNSWHPNWLNQAATAPRAILAASSYPAMGARLGDPSSPDEVGTEFPLDVYMPHEVKDGAHYFAIAPDLILSATPSGEGTAAIANVVKFVAQLYADDKYLPNGKPLHPRTVCDMRFAENGELVVVGRGIFTKNTIGLPYYGTGLPQLSGFIQAESFYSKNPDTGAPWSSADADVAEIGARIIA